MRYRELNEVSHVDLYPAQFVAFRQKWLPHASPPGRFYVNFTDHAGNTLDRNFSPKPNHRDPSGLYAYPLDYVLNHPADIEYGQQARYLRVVEDTSAHKLVLQDLTMDEALRYLTAMGVEEPAKKMAFMGRHYKYRGGAPVAIAFFGVVQGYTEVGQKKVRTNAEQTRLLLSAGIDALEDRATRQDTAVIYEAEPEQIVFLRRSAFKVVDAFELRSSQSVNIAKANPTEMLRRLPAMIATAIGDRIVNGHSDGAADREQTYYTAAQRKIAVSVAKEYSFQRSHREGSTNSGAAISVRLLGPDFKPIAHTFDKTATFAEIAAEMRTMFDAREAGEGEAYSRQGDYGAAADACVSLYAALATKLKLPFDPPASGSNLAYLVFAATRMVEQPSDYNLKLPERSAKIIREFWSRFRRQPAQVEQIIAILDKAYRKAGSKMAVSANTLEALASSLGIKPVAPVDTPQQDGVGFRMAVTGHDIVASIDGSSAVIGEVDNNRTTWTTPKGNDRTIYLPHAKEIATFLNRKALFCEGYVEFLAQYYGVIFDGKTWSTLADAVKPEVLDDEVSLWRLPSGKGGGTVCARYSGQSEGKKSYSGETAEPSTWTLMEPILFLDEEGAVSSISSTYERHVRFGRKTETSGVSVGFNHLGHDTTMEPINKLFAALDTSGFDIQQYMAKNGMTFSKHFHGDLDWLGLVYNRQNGKVGEKIRDVLSPEGTYAGLPMACYQGRYDNPTYYVRGESGWSPAVVVEMDAKTGKRPVKITGMSSKLTPEQRLAVREFLVKQDLPVPKKFTAALTVAKPRKGAKPENTAR